MSGLSVWARLAVMFAMLALPGASAAQGRAIDTPLVTGEAVSPILTLESDRLFAESAFGRRIQTELEAARKALVAENERITADLTEEERRLTNRRPDMDPTAFRALAEAFDDKVQTFRSAQDEKARDLESRNEEARRVFIQAARPVISAILRETGAAIIVERRIVIVSADEVDITDLAVSRIDAAIGNGSDILAPQP